MEYKVLVWDVYADVSLESVLNATAKEGWRLVSLCGKDSVHMVFERQK